MTTVRVECYAGYRGEEEPRCLHLGEEAIELVEVLDRWLDPDHRYFKCRGSDDAVYILRHDTRTGSWMLTLYDRIQLVD